MSSSTNKSKSARAVHEAARAVGLNEQQKLELRDLFEDVYVENRRKIMLTNFLRGIAFGLGTFIGGTIVVAIIIWVLNKTTDIFPWVSGFSENLMELVERK